MTKKFELFYNRLKSVANAKTDKQLADYLGLKKTTFSMWKNRESVDYNLLFKKCGHVSLDWLLKGEEPDKNSKSNNVSLPKVITTSTTGKENILMVPVPAQAGYLSGYGDPDFLKSLPSYSLPKLTNGTYRMFEVKGHSMYPTIHSGAIAVGEFVESLTDIVDNNIYIVVSKDNGIIIKRLLNRLLKYDNLFAKSDNRREYPSFTIDPEEILEVWKLKTAFIFDFQDPSDIYERVNDLESEVLNLKNRISK